MQLTNEQVNVRNEILLWLKSKNSNNVLRVDASAGFGKTYLIAQSLDYFSNRILLSPLITAPTNEAVNQLKIKIPVSKIRYDFKTTYSALGYRLVATKYNSYELKHFPKPLDNYNLIVVDEYSCLPKSIAQHLLSLKIKILLVGHSKQLPEIDTELQNNQNCIPYLSTLDITTLTLTKNLRANKKLAEFCAKVELSINEEVKPKYKYQVQSIEFLKHKVENGKGMFLEGTHKVLCYTNICADRYNAAIRRSIFGDNFRKPYVKGDLIIPIKPARGFLKPFKESHIPKAKEGIILAVNTALRVLECVEVKLLQLSAYRLMVETMGKGVYYIYVSKVEKYYKHLAINYKKKYKSNEDFYKLCNVFSSVKYSYAVTVHRSQGMTIEIAYIIFKDIERCRNKYLRQRLFFVAYSRAAKDLYTII